jgi:hypothetical protein
LAPLWRHFVSNGEAVFELDDTISTAADPLPTAYSPSAYRFPALYLQYPTVFLPLSDPLSTALLNFILRFGDLTKNRTQVRFTHNRNVRIKQRHRGNFQKMALFY